MTIPSLTGPVSTKEATKTIEVSSFKDEIGGGGKTVEPSPEKSIKRTQS